MVPEAGAFMTFAEYQASCQGQYSEEEIQAEWNALPDRRFNPEDGQWQSWEELQAAFPESSEEELASFWGQYYTVAHYMQTQGQEQAEAGEGDDAAYEGQGEEGGEEGGEEVGEEGGEEAEEAAQEDEEGDAGEPESKKQRTE
ncbi:unnamed protein product [Polarella glacialis]|nr:unnamed protein product [Polarella glacialis]